MTKSQTQKETSSQCNTIGKNTLVSSHTRLLYLPGTSTFKRLVSFTTNIKSAVCQRHPVSGKPQGCPWDKCAQAAAGQNESHHKPGFDVPQVETPTWDDESLCGHQVQLGSAGKANLLTPGCGEAKYSIYLQGIEQGEQAVHAQKIQTPWWLSGKGY